MAKATNKTIENEGSVSEFLSSVADNKRREDAMMVHEMMVKITDEEPKMWGTSIVGFGKYHYKYDSGREGEFMKVGYSPRILNLTIYIMTGFDRYDALMSQLGKHKTGKSCLYIKKMEDINQDVLSELISLSYAYMTEKYG